MKFLNRATVKSQAFPKRQGNIARKTLIALVLLLIVLCGVYYYIWRQARIDAWIQGENSKHYTTLRETFMSHLNAGELDQAYVLTSRRFQREVSRDGFAILAKRFITLDNEPQNLHLGEGFGSSGPPGGDPGNPNHQYMSFEHELRYRDGKLITLTMQIRREPDHLLLFYPPSFKIDVLKVEERQEPKVVEQ